MQAARLSRYNIDVVRRSILLVRSRTHVVSSCDRKNGSASQNLTAALATLDWSSSFWAGHLFRQRGCTFSDGRVYFNGTKHALPWIAPHYIYLDNRNGLQQAKDPNMRGKIVEVPHRVMCPKAHFNTSQTKRFKNKRER